MNLPEERKLPFLNPISLPGSQKAIKAKTIVISLLLLMAFLFTFSLYQRTIHIDEATLAEQVYWLMEEGIVKSVLYTGIGTGLGEELLVYHKFFIWVATAISYPFGIELPLLRSISLLCGLLLCFSLYRYSKEQLGFEGTQLNLLSLLLILLLFSNSIFFFYSFIFRPEMMQTWLGFLSFYMLAAYLKKPQLKYLALSAILAGLAILTHLNGLVFMGAGGLLLLYKRQLKALGIFALIGLAVTGIYAVDMLKPGDFEQFITQFAGAPAFRKSDLHPLNRVLRVLDEHKRYFYSAQEVSFSILFILLIGARFKYLWKHHRNLMLYTLFGGISLAVINQGQSSKYALLLLPFACLLMALSFMNLLQHKRKYISWFSAAFLVYFVIQLYAIMELIDKRMDLPARNAQISQYIPKGSRVLAPGSFFFNEFRDYEIISFDSYYTMVDRFNSLKYTKKDFLYHPHSLGCDYVIIDLFFTADGAQEGIRPDEFRVGNSYFGYQVIQVENNYIILEAEKGPKQKQITKNSLDSLPKTN